MFKKKVVVAVVAAVAVVLLLAAPVLAKNPHGVQGSADSDRPGWGYGDSNHTHTGPPGTEN